MSGLKGLKYLDYAVYGNVIVPLLNFGTDVWFQIDEDEEAGLCRVESRLRKPKKIKIGGQGHGERGKYF